MKLNAVDVQAIRSLGKVGFSSSSLGDAYGLTGRAIWDILRGRSWAFLPVTDVELPVLPIEATARLRFRSAKKLTAEQRKVLEHYRDKLALRIDVEADREAFALSCFRQWTHRRPRPRGSRKVAAV